MTSLFVLSALSTAASGQGVRRFDMGSATSPVAAGYTAVTPASTYSVAAGSKVRAIFRFLSCTERGLASRNRADWRRPTPLASNMNKVTFQSGRWSR